VYRWVEHTSELELEIEAATEDDVYGDAVVAMGELLSGDEPAGGDVREREVAVRGGDRAQLLAELLGEIAFLAESERFVPVALERLAAGPSRLEAVVRGHEGDPPHLVKAITYHRLAFEPRDEGWRATVVMDV
jgi:SHS2 domain-containing protein